MNEDDEKLVNGFNSYVNKAEITDIPPSFLVYRSKNVLIDYAKRVISRLGYTLYGSAGTLGNPSIKSSYEWDTSTAKQFPIRVWGQNLEFYWNSTWNRLSSTLTSPYVEFAKIWDLTEKIDVLLWVLGETNTYKWSGAVAKIASATGTTITKQGVLSNKTTIAFVAGTLGSIAPTITDSALNFLNAGFAAGDTLTVSGSTANSRNFTIGSVTAGVITLIMTDILTAEAVGTSVTLHNGEPTWATSRFLTAGTRKVTYQGVDYAYTGGETTDTLTGLTGFPSITLGDSVWQTPITLANPGAINASFKQNLIGVQLNQLILASTKSQEIYISLNTDYTTFALTSPRAPGDPAKLTMDNFCTCIVPVDNPQKTFNGVVFGGGTNEFFQLSYSLSQDNTNELVRMIKLETAASSGLIAKGAIGPIKHATVYINREPALDTLGTVESVDGKRNVPISDPIKNDFDTYNFTNAHVKYWKRAVYIALPAHGIVLIYDLMRSLWQPPQTIPVSRLAVINDWLYGHSSVTNETYKLFVGTNDNGAPISQVARFGYNNGGARDRLKNMSEYWSDGYISAGGILGLNVNLGFNGSIQVLPLTIKGSDTAITTAVDASPLGVGAEGSDPLGGAAPGLAIAADPTSGMRRFWQEDTLSQYDYIEHFVEYTMSTLDGQFALVAHGSNQWDAGTAPVTHKK